MEGNTVNRKHLVAALAATTLLVPLAACTSDEGTETPTASDCTNTIVNADAPAVSVWGWYPNMDKVVDNFNNSHDDVQACWTNVGQGNDEYDKFQTAISAGTGAPDVIMLEADRIPNYVVQNALVESPSETPSTRLRSTVARWR
jgi:multiple sugar transport system substrate-binding protein